jgi:methionine sulfoxide reductase heme-binding subunit
MKIKTLVSIGFGIIIAVSYMLLANSLKTTPQIWLLTRGFGLAAFAALSSLVIIGELRLLGFNKLFKLHCSAGVLTFYIALLHGLSAVFDKFKWGVNLNFTDFLGFNYSSKWLILLSIGTIAFYLIILVALTSSMQAIQMLGFKKWKIVHYLSYAAIAAVFAHSMLLGTDIKTSSLSWIVLPAVVSLFAAATGLLAIRIIRQSLTPKQITMVIFAAVLLSAAVAYCSAIFNISENYLNSLKQQDKQLAQETRSMENENLRLYYSALNISQQISDLQKNKSNAPAPAVVPQTSPPAITPAQQPLPELEEEDEEEIDDD